MLLTVRRAVVGVIGTGAVASAMLLGAAPSALADPPPNCTAGDLAQVAAGVSASTSVYLFTHPDVNDFFNTLEGLSRAQAAAKTKDYLNSHPQAQAELAGIRQPLVDMKDRCAAPPSP